MAEIENTVLFKRKDNSGNTYIFHPITSADNVEGLTELIDEAKIVGKGVLSTGTNEAYAVTVSGITALESGVSFIMIPHVTSNVVAPTLNVNDLGAKTLRVRVSGSTSTTVVASTTNWLVANKPVRVTYDGMFWVAEIARPNANDIFGTISIEHGGTGATTAAEALTNLGAAPLATRVTVTLAASAWDSTAKTQTVTVTGVSADEPAQLIIPTPSLASQSAYIAAGILCTGQAADSLTFTASTVPTADLTVYVTIQGVAA